MEDIISLMYHDSYIVNKSESGFKLAGADVYKIKPQVFEHQLQLIEKYISQNGINKNCVRFTFDDGGISFYTIYAPILEKYGYKGYFFITTSLIATDGFMTEDQIKELDKRGHIIGGHSDSHRQRMNDLTYEELLEDWSKCSERLSAIVGHPITVCSLPCGYESKSMVAALKDLGYTDIYTSAPETLPEENNGVFLYGRFGIKEVMTDEYVLSIVSSSFVRYKIKARKAIPNFAKKILGNAYVVIREKISK